MAVNCCKIAVANETPGVHPVRKVTGFFESKGFRQMHTLSEVTSVLHWSETQGYTNDSKVW